MHIIKILLTLYSRHRRSKPNIAEQAAESGLEKVHKCHKRS